MTRRATALNLAAFTLAASLVSSPHLHAQTKPKVTVPPEKRSQAHGIVQQLLREGKIIRSSEVKRGMRGIARSVFQGTKIEEFQVEVLGVLGRVQGGSDLVLIKVLDGPVVKRNSGIIAGMSGSPVYINGKMLGAIAIGWGFPKEPIGGVTPITQMIETSLPDPSRGVTRPAPAAGSIPKSATAKKAVKTAARPDPTLGAYTPKGDLRIAGRKIAKVVVSRDSNRLALADSPHGATMNMRPVSTLLQLSGFSETTLPMLRRAFERYGIEPVIGPSSRKAGPNPPFVPGAAIGVQLVSGDMDQTAVGTVTFRWGNRILGFGHPMFGQGSTSLPMTTSYIHDIFPSYQRSFKLSSPINVVGALQQDTEFAIGGTIGAVADTIPVSIGISDPQRQIKKTYHVRVMKDPILTPNLLGAVATEAITTTLGQASDKMVRIGLRMAIDGAPTLVKHNYLYAPGDISEAALADLGQSIAITQMNEFARGSIRRVDLTVALEPVRKTARIKSLFADRNKVKAGETVRINVVLEPDGAPGRTITKTFSFAVPADAPTGSMRIAAGPSSAYYPLRMRVGAPPPDPTNLKELIAAYSNLGPANELMVDASTSDTFLLVDRVKVSDPAPIWTKLLRNSASTVIGTYNEVITRREKTEYSLSGAQTITIPVESLKDRDKLTVTSDTTTPTAKPDITITTESTDGTISAAATAEGEEAGEAAKAGFSPRRIEKLFNSAPFLADMKAWKRMVEAVPGREQPVRPVTPTVTSPTPTPTPSATPTPTPVPTPVVLPVDGGKGVGRPALSWVQASPTDFLRGTFDRAQVSSEGAIRLSPPTKLLATTAEAFAWSIAGDNAGNVYLGTGNKARILKINAKGEVSTLYEGSEVAVTALTTDSAGNVYAGVSPGGRVYSFSPSGQKSLVFDSRQTFVWALDWDAAGNLLVGTGGAKGKLYRVRHNSDAKNYGAALYSANATPLATVEQKHIRAIAVRGQEIFVGTAGDGVLYKIDAGTGAATALYETGNDAGGTTAVVAAGVAQPATEITSVVAAPEGVYFGALNSGTIFRWTEDVGVVAIYPSPQQSVYALKRTADGRLFAATGDKGIVYQIVPAENPSNVRGARILEPTQLQGVTLAVSPAGDLLVGTANNAAAYRVSLAANNTEATSGSFTSAVFDAKNTVRWGALRVIGNATVETRSGNTADPDGTWSAWQAVERNDLGETRIVSPGGRYLQYRAHLTVPNGEDVNGSTAPALQRVEIVYRAKNLPPTVAFTSPRGGEFWNKKKKLTWAGTDPNSDTLDYRLSISGDDGKTWQAVALTDESTASFDLDTSKYTDGVYRARVIASDAGRNPDEPLTDESIGAPFVIDNTVPVLGTPVVVTQPDGSVRISVTATDAFSPIVSAAWRVAPVKPVTPTPTPTPAPIAAPVPAKAAEKPAKTKGKKEAPAPAATAAATAASATTAGTSTTATPAATLAATAITTVAVEAKPEIKTEEEDKWLATVTEDGLFDSRRETVIAIVPTDKTAGSKGRSVEVRIRDAADNVATLTINLP